MTRFDRTTDKSVADVFVAFFDEDHPAGFELDKKSDSWKDDMDPLEKKRYKNKFANIKRAVRMVLMHADSYPLIPEDPSQYKEVLRRTATAAEERIRNNLGFEDKRISIYTLTSLSEIKTLEKTLRLPSNTPVEELQFFNK